MLALLVSAVVAVSVQDHVAGAEVGDERTSVTFSTDGKYQAERREGGGKTVARGTWKIEGDKLAVTVKSCTGKSCSSFGASFTAQIRLPTANAMIVVAEPANAALSSGAYFCMSEGCEKRVGVEIASAGGGADTLRFLTNYVANQEQTKDSTVVWTTREKDTADKTAIQYCAGGGERSKKSAELIASELARVPWFGRVAPIAAPEGTPCVADVRVVVGEDVRSARR